MVIPISKWRDIICLQTMIKDQSKLHYIVCTIILNKMERTCKAFRYECFKRSNNANGDLSVTQIVPGALLLQVSVVSNVGMQ